MADRTLFCSPIICLLFFYINFFYHVAFHNILNPGGDHFKPFTLTIPSNILPILPTETSPTTPPYRLPLPPIADRLSPNP